MLCISIESSVTNVNVNQYWSYSDFVPLSTHVAQVNLNSTPNLLFYKCILNLNVYKYKFKAVTVNQDLV